MESVFILLLVGGPVKECRSSNVSASRRGILLCDSAAAPTPLGGHAKKRHITLHVKYLTMRLP
jgi:hypothetical protein